MLYLQSVRAAICTRFLPAIAYWHWQTTEDNGQQIQALSTNGFNLLMASASEAYLQKIFSLCGDLTIWKQNAVEYRAQSLPKAEKLF